MRGLHLLLLYSDGFGSKHDKCFRLHVRGHDAMHLSTVALLILLEQSRIGATQSAEQK
jgi:hypothetical protein